jgi:hypothetical protein
MDGAFARQDGQVLPGPQAADEPPHADQRVDDRAPEPWSEYPALYLWREAEHVGWLGFGRYVRYHEPSGLALIAEFGFLHTALRPGEGAVGQLVERAGYDIQGGDER